MDRLFLFPLLHIAIHEQFEGQAIHTSHLLNSPNHEPADSALVVTVLGNLLISIIVNIFSFINIINSRKVDYI